MTIENEVLELLNNVKQPINEAITRPYIQNKIANMIDEYKTKQQWLEQADIFTQILALEICEEPMLAGYQFQFICEDIEKIVQDTYDRFIQPAYLCVRLAIEKELFNPDTIFDEYNEGQTYSHIYTFTVNGCTFKNVDRPIDCVIKLIYDFNERRAAFESVTDGAPFVQYIYGNKFDIAFWNAIKQIESALQ